MPIDLIKTIEGLLESGRGNKSELEHILMLLKANRSLPRFDQTYLEILLAKKPINYRGYNKYKSEGITLVLSLLFGLFGFLGFGHRYVGHVVKSLAILYSGWTLIILNLLNFYPLAYSEMNTKFGNNGISFPPFAGLASLLPLDPQLSVITSSVVTVGASVGFFALYVWQIWDARRVAREFNRYMDEKGSQLYEMTMAKKIVFALVVLAPIFAAIALGLVLYLNSIIHFMPILDRI